MINRRFPQDKNVKESAYSTINRIWRTISGLNVRKESRKKLYVITKKELD